MPSQYPDAIYTPRTMVNRVGVLYDETKTKVIYAEDINKDRAEIVAIENELGTNAKGTFSSIKANLEALWEAISGFVSSQWVSITGAIYFNSGVVGIGTDHPLNLLDTNNGVLAVHGESFTRIAIDSEDGNAGFVLAQIGVAKYVFAVYGDGLFTIYDIVREVDTLKITKDGDVFFNAANVYPPSVVALSPSAFRVKSGGGELVGAYDDTAPYSWWFQSRIYNQAVSLPIVFQPMGGNFGIGTRDPKSVLHVVGIPVYANNAAAVAGGLTAGAFYRTGANPDPVCIVH